MENTAGCKTQWHFHDLRHFQMHPAQEEPYEFISMI